MFQQAEQRPSVSKSEYREREPVLRQKLLEIQQTLRNTAEFPVIILFAGVDSAGKGETVNLLSEWMDPRWLVTRAYDQPSDEDQERPEFWRYWRTLPPKGRIGLLLSAWYSRPVVQRAYAELSEVQLESRLQQIEHFEATLVNDGAVILKFWLHLSAKEQQKRLRAFEADPLLSWRVKQSDWNNWQQYDAFMDATEQTIQHTHSDEAPWHIISGWDKYHRSLAVGEIIQDRISTRLEQKKPARKKSSRKKPPLPEIPQASLLKQLDLSQSLPKPDYKSAIKTYQAQLNRWHRIAADKGISTILVFEGPDAAGKGGAIRRITAALDARRYEVLPFAAPTDEEKAHHYLWRFWRHLSRAGRFLLFDRSWYGRVLVERVEGFARQEEWQRAYGEINDFEQQLAEHGIVLLKYWLQIDSDEQLRRFEDRQKTPHKRWKLTDEDWRNREKWSEYELAAHDMIEKTSTEIAPWILVAANDKRFARVKVLRTLCEKLEEALS